MKQHFNAQVVRATTGVPFPMHTSRDGRVFAEVEPGTESALRIITTTAPWSSTKSTAAAFRIVNRYGQARKGLVGSDPCGMG